MYHWEIEVLEIRIQNCLDGEENWFAEKGQNVTRIKVKSPTCVPKVNCTDTEYGRAGSVGVVQKETGKFYLALDIN